MTPVKVAFLLVSNSRYPIPSTRIAALNMFPFLRASNFDPQIVFEPETDTEFPDVSQVAGRILQEKFDLVVFQKVHGPSVLELSRRVASAGCKTLCLVCDRVNAAVVEATDATAVVTEYLKSLYPAALQSKIHVVHDGIEHPEIQKEEWSNHRGSPGDPLRAVLVTSARLDYLPIIRRPPDWLEVTIVGDYPPANPAWNRLRAAARNLHEMSGATKRIEYLRFLTSRRIRCVPWSPASVYNFMRRSDIGIIPIDETPPSSPGMPAPVWKVKSENRLTMKMSVGLPVIASAIPSYEAVIEQGQNGFVARSISDWIEFLERLREPALRRTMGLNARASVLQRYSREEQARRLIEVIRSLVPGAPDRTT
ncbi:MAG TPA: glycosyltransferase family 4 protein [Bryobacteraceae bacterium]|nr:glycosyltransferase family 4 protein [Bryobacteraceae bacterium]